MPFPLCVLHLDTVACSTVKKNKIHAHSLSRARDDIANPLVFCSLTMLALLQKLAALDSGRPLPFNFELVEKLDPHARIVRLQFKTSNLTKAVSYSDQTQRKMSFHA